jgi:hypothetical protein
MKAPRADKLQLTQHLDCFGDFAMENAVCRKYCALNLMCAIEKDHNLRMELFEEMLSADGTPLRVQ